MVFREKLEDIMEEACLSNDQKNVLTEWAVKQIFAGGRNVNMEMNNDLRFIVEIIENHNLKEEFDELMASDIDFSKDYDDNCALCH